MQILLQVLNKEPKADGAASAFKVELARPEGEDANFADLIARPEAEEQGAIAPAADFKASSKGVLPKVETALGVLDSEAPDAETLIVPPKAANTPVAVSDEPVSLPILVAETTPALSKEAPDPQKGEVQVPPVMRATPPVAAPVTLPTELAATEPLIRPKTSSVQQLPAPVASSPTPLAADVGPPPRPKVADTMAEVAKPLPGNTVPIGPDSEKLAERPVVGTGPVAKTEGELVPDVPPARTSTRPKTPAGTPENAPPANAPVAPVHRRKAADAPILPEPTPKVVPDRPTQASQDLPLVRPTSAPPPPRPLVAIEAAKAPPSKPHRAPRAASALDVSISVATPSPAAAAPETAQNVQMATVLTQNQIMKDAAFGRDPGIAKDEALPPLVATETTDSRRTLDTPAPRIEAAARPVLTQLVQAARTAIDGMVEVKLSPEELGRVRLAMTTVESGMTILVTAERPETLDLIRRNIDLFASDLADQGFTDLNFSFGDETAHQDGEAPDETSDKTRLAAPTDLRTMFEGRIDMKHVTPDGRVDLRL